MGLKPSGETPVISVGFTGDRKKNEKAALMGGILQQVAPRNGETLGYPSVGMWSKMACLLEDWGRWRRCLRQQKRSYAKQGIP